MLDSCAVTGAVKLTTARKKSVAITVNSSTLVTLKNGLSRGACCADGFVFSKTTQFNFTPWLETKSIRNELTCSSFKARRESRLSPTSRQGGPKRERYSLEVMNALTISALTTLPLN